MTNILEYPYPVTLKCNACGREVKATYSNAGVTVEAPCQCKCEFSYSVVDDLSFVEWQEARKQKEQELLERLPKLIPGILDQYEWLSKDEGGEYKYEIYAYYNDELDDKMAAKILEDDNPMDCFYETIWEGYSEAEFDQRDEICKFVAEELLEQYPEYNSFFFDGEDEELIRDFVMESVYFDLPYDHYLNQEFNAPIFVDTGDANYDYVLNSVYPAYGHYEDEPIDDKASLVWLAEQQGYTKEQLWKALLEEDGCNPSGFLESVRCEVANEVSSMNRLTIPLKVSLRDLIEINELIKRHCKECRSKAEKRSDYGTIVIGKKAYCGLYDPWNGGGSCFEIELEKDLELPISLIAQELVPDGTSKHEYGLDACYDFCGSVWADGRIIEIKKPENIDNEGENKNEK